MALVTISGFPCSGKTTAARALERDFTARLGEPSYKGPRLRVVVVDDESNHVPRSTYDGEPRLFGCALVVSLCVLCVRCVLGLVQLAYTVCQNR